MKRKVTLIADEGMVLTDGKDCCKRVSIAVGEDESVYYEITEAEGKALEAEHEALNRAEE